MTRARATVTDEIVEEVRKAKQRLAARFDFDVVAMLKDAQKRQGTVVEGVVRATSRKGTSRRPPRPHVPAGHAD